MYGYMAQIYSSHSYNKPLLSCDMLPGRKGLNIFLIFINISNFGFSFFKTFILILVFFFLALDPYHSEFWSNIYLVLINIKILFLILINILKIFF